MLCCKKSYFDSKPENRLYIVMNFTKEETLDSF